MPEMYLKQPGFTYSACKALTKDNLDLLIVLTDHLLKTEKEFKISEKQERQNMFTEIN